MRVYSIYCTRQTNASTLTSSPVFQIPADLTWKGAARRHLADDQAVVDGRVSKVGAGASGSQLHETLGILPFLTVVRRHTFGQQSGTKSLCDLGRPV